jgi:hypothetical protein
MRHEKWRQRVAEHHNISNRTADVQDWRWWKTRCAVLLDDLAYAVDVMAVFEIALDEMEREEERRMGWDPRPRLDLKGQGDEITAMSSSRREGDFATMSSSSSNPEPVSIQAGDILFLEREVSGIPWPTGYYVLRLLTQGCAIVSLLGQDDAGLYATDSPYTISVEDLPAFSATGQRARTTK